MEKFVNQVINDNCMNIMYNIPTYSFDHIITDIPYSVINRDNNGLRNFNKKNADELTFNLDLFLSQLIRITKNKIFIFCSSEQVSSIFSHFNANGLYSHLAIWEKSNPSPINGQYLWLSGVECCVIGEKNRTIFKPPLWKFSSGKSKIHPTEKPLSLMEFIINNYTYHNDLIYDPCFGSGSTLVAAKKNNRRYFGTEISKDYFNITQERLEKIQ